MPDTTSARHAPWRGSPGTAMCLTTTMPPGPMSLRASQPKLVRLAGQCRSLALAFGIAAAVPATVLAQATPPAAAPATASAAALARPTGKVILTLSGKIDKTNAPGKAEFDMAMLAALPQHSFTTSTPWFKVPRKFTGPLLRDVLDAAGAKGAKLRAVALNDYKVDLPADDTRQWGVVLARLLDDQPMPVREKGPLFIIYPFDEDQTLRSERYYSRCAWQLKSLQVD